MKIMSKVVCTKPREEYEDDFEKDLDWLISEESRSEGQGSNYDDTEAEIDKELEADEKHKENKKKPKSRKEEKRSRKIEETEEDEDRWPSPMAPLEYDSDRDSPNKSVTVVPAPPGMEDQTDEERKIILEKIQQANHKLQHQESPDMSRRRRLHFRETLVDLVVSPLQDGDTAEVEEGQGMKHLEEEIEVSGKLSELKPFLQEESGCRESDRAGESSEGGVKEGRVLVEKDGKFDLVSLKEVEGQGLLPPIANHNSDSSSPRHQEKTMSSSKTHRSSSSCHLRAGPSSLQHGVDHPHVPRPPVQPRSRSSSAIHSQRRDSKRRVQSATVTPCQATYTLSPQQKEMVQRIQERKHKLAKEEEQRKREEEEQKRQENELAFKAWLLRKKEQLEENKRIHRAQNMERMNSKKEPNKTDESFRLWLQRKQEQQQKERQLVELRRLEADSGNLLRSREECERAFKLWLKRKWAEKRVEQQMARERSRRLILEERHARSMRDLMCTVSETKPFRFTKQLAYF